MATVKAEPTDLNVDPKVEVKSQKKKEVKSMVGVFEVVSAS